MKKATSEAHCNQREDMRPKPYTMPDGTVVNVVIPRKMVYTHEEAMRDWQVINMANKLREDFKIT
jgi:hypothetical protein